MDKLLDVMGKRLNLFEIYRVNMETVKNCSRCNVEYPATLEFFYKKVNSPSGLRSECKKCSNLDATVYANKNRDKRREWDKKSYQKHSDERKKSQRDYRNNNPKGIHLTYSNNAKFYNREMSLTIEDVDNITSLLCYYCGQLTVNRVGIDRVDNSKGYTLENCVPCCKVCNFAKGALSKDQFLNLAFSIFKHHNS